MNWNRTQRRDNGYNNRGFQGFYKLPDRWESYSDFGNRIPGTRFICMKVPLKEELCQRNNIDTDKRFTPKRMVSEMKKRDIKIGLLIDLTNTKRYYHSSEVTELGVGYEKIFVEGHEIPSQDVVNRFYTAIDAFENVHKESENDGALIGVHCTHGINRTGYLVCRYLIERKGWTAEKAIDEFNQARGHKIERENYLEDLKNRTLLTDYRSRIEGPAGEAPLSTLSTPPKSKPEMEARSSSAFSRTEAKDRHGDHAWMPDRMNENWNNRWNRRNDWSERNNGRYNNDGRSYQRHYDFERGRSMNDQYHYSSHRHEPYESRNGYDRHEIRYQNRYYYRNTNDDYTYNYGSTRHRSDYR